MVKPKLSFTRRLKFTRRILHDLWDAASYLNKAEQEIKIAKDIIDKAVIRELKTKRKKVN